MPQVPKDLILLDGVTGTGVGLVVGFGDAMRYANGAGVNRHLTVRKFKARCILTDTAAGTTATVKIQDSNDNSSYTDLYSFTFAALTSAALSKVLAAGFSTKKKYVRANVTALAGGTAPTINCYLTLGTWGM